MSYILRMNAWQKKSRKSPCIGITLPRELIALVDKRAAQARQSRSRFIATALWQFAEERTARPADLLERLDAIERRLGEIAGRGGKRSRA